MSTQTPDMMAYLAYCKRRLAAEQAAAYLRGKSVTSRRGRAALVRRALRGGV